MFFYIDKIFCGYINFGILFAILIWNIFCYINFGIHNFCYINSSYYTYLCTLELITSKIKQIFSLLSKGTFNNYVRGQEQGGRQKSPDDLLWLFFCCIKKTCLLEFKDPSQIQISAEDLSPLDRAQNLFNCLEHENEGSLTKEEFIAGYLERNVLMEKQEVQEQRIR